MAENILSRRPAAIDFQDSNNQTVLHLASTHGYEKVVKELLAQRASVDLQDNNNQTPLTISIIWGHVKVVELILARKNECNKSNHACILACDERKHTPIFYGLANRRTEVVKLLLLHEKDW